MAKKRLLNETMTVEEDAKKMLMRYNFLKEDYVELQRRVRALRKRVQRNKDKKKRLEAEVRFLRRKYQMFIKKDREEPAHPLVFPESSTKVFSVYRRPKELTEVLALEDKPARSESIGLQAWMSTDHCPSPEMAGLQPSPMRIMPTLAVPHSSFVMPVVELANKKRDLKNNGLVSAQKPSKVKDGRNKKTKADLLVSPGYSAKSVTVSRRSKETTEALTTEDKSTRHGLNGMQTKSSIDDCSLPEMLSATRIMPHFKVPHGSLVMPTVIDNQNEKIKADPLESPEFSVKTNSRGPKEPTKGLATEDEPERCELIGMQPLLSKDDCTAPEMTRLQPSAMQIIPSFEVRHSSSITPAVEPANKKRRLENNGLFSAQKPAKVKDGRNRKSKADPLVFPEFDAINISISSRPEEMTGALATEDEPARYELSGMQPLLSTDNCTLPEMTRLQPSATGIITAYTVPHRSLVTPIVEPTNKKRPLENNGLVGAQKHSNVIDGQNKKIECGAENLSIFRRTKEPIEALPIEDRPARHELTELQLFPSSDACMAPKMTGLQPSPTRMIPPCTTPQGLVVTTTVKPAIRRQNNGLASAQKPPKVKDSKRKKTKDNPPKPISLMEERGVGSFWDN